jgi:hypothetical protein
MGNQYDMKIEIGKFYMNKTREYLLPCLCDHGKTLMKAINGLKKLAVGTGDQFITGSVHKNHIFLLVDIDCKNFTQILKWIKTQSFYVNDYPFDDILSGYQHMIVLQIPENYEDAKPEFVEGKYSKMYTQEQINHVFNNRYMDVLVRDKEKLISFISTVNKMYDVRIDYRTWQGEVEFPPVKEEEIFNFKKQ